MSENKSADISVVVDIAEQIMRGVRAFHRRDIAERAVFE